MHACGQGAIDGGPKICIAVRFEQALDVLEVSDHGDDLFGGMSRREHNWYEDFAPDEFVVKFGTRHLRHHHIEDQAVGFGNRRRLKELVSRCEGLNGKPQML